MLTAVKAESLIPFKDHKITDLRKINFVYGPNGSGKTTLSSLIAKDGGEARSALSWGSTGLLDRVVFNRDFVKLHFNADKHLKGVFTLGKDAGDTKAKIDEIEGQIRTIESDLSRLKLALGDDESPLPQSKRGQRERAWNAFADACWKAKSKEVLGELLMAAFSGFGNSKKKFAEEFLKFVKSNASKAPMLAELQKRAAVVFSADVQRLQRIPNIDLSELVKVGQDPILKKRVVGKEDVDIGSLIDRLDISDWVNQGRSHYSSLEHNRCPFCQQRTPADLKLQLEQYFDEAYFHDTDAIVSCVNTYESVRSSVELVLANLLASPPVSLDVRRARSISDAIQAVTSENVSILRRKQSEPRLAVELKELGPLQAQISECLEAANNEADEHNKLLDNLPKESKRLRDDAWSYLAQQTLAADLAALDAAIEPLDKAIRGMTERIQEHLKELAAKRRAIADLERQRTSTKPTVDSINRTLVKCGFGSFKLEAAEEGHAYRIVRANGTPALESLSEGERSFITFLYFYHLTRGGSDATGINTRRLVVIDDPVSSMDSNVLYIVSHLCRELIASVRDGSGPIRQVILLTHNVAFHHEVAFDPRRDRHVARLDESFWTIAKTSEGSELRRHEQNPIRTSYQWLWAEVRDHVAGKHTLAPVALQNCLRRILESYFKLFGGLDPKDLVQRLAFEEQVVCRSLLSWLDAGSHGLSDDIEISPDAQIGRELAVFERIFAVAGHQEHYRMMLGAARSAAEGQVSQADEVKGIRPVVKRCWA